MVILSGILSSYDDVQQYSQYDAPEKQEDAEEIKKPVKDIGKEYKKQLWLFTIDSNFSQVEVGM